MSKADEMYSEEELNAIERLDRLTIGSIIQTTDIENASTIMYDKIILLNLINKQQKKIENSVSKDIIRELIEECKKEGCCSNKEYYDNKCLEICRFYEVCTLLRNLLERK